MSIQNIRILDFDASLIKQQEILQKYSPQIIDLSAFGPRVRLWMDKKTKLAIEGRLCGLAENSLIFLGSGDFHHISSILIDQSDEPFSLVVFDFHPDWDIIPPKYGCGSWVTQALKNKNIKKCLLVGIASNDISTGYIQSGNLGSLKDSRVRIYPYYHKPSRVFLRDIPQNDSLRLKKCFLGSQIYWSELAGKNLADFFLSVIQSLPTRQVYVSIDKDCLKREYALTNWEEGLLSLEELLLMLKVIRDHLEIIGVDITGEYSPVILASKFKAFFSRLDHPKDVAANHSSDSLIHATNQDTNLRILETLID
ncbi:MAG: hypothetical protein PHC54_06130 [Candidatus Omnitrophica bacterium]|nr:hypothetical protein [Candidatus Omnitrophota bacterium]MDD5592753.1 hypothetical protein [Candidatus Omnitrophota bacterium]